MISEGTEEPTATDIPVPETVSASDDAGAPSISLVLQDESDEEKLEEMTNWLVHHAEILPSIAKRYCGMFVSEGISTIRRLGKRIQRHNEFLSSLGINQDDEEEIIEVLTREGYYKAHTNFVVGWNNPHAEAAADENQATPDYIADNINEIHKKGHHVDDEEDEDASDPEDGDDRLNSPMARIFSNGSESPAGHHDANTQAVPFSSADPPKLSLQIPNERERSGSVRSDNNNVNRDRAASVKQGDEPQQPVTRDRSGSVIARERAASVIVVDTTVKKSRSSAEYKKIVQIEKSAKFKESVAAAASFIEKLETANEAKMEAAVVGVLTDILCFVEGSTEKQRAMYRNGAIATSIANLLQNMGGSALVCERSLQVVAVICRHSDENKASVSYENARSFGQAGLCEIIPFILKNHAGKYGVVASICDAIRCLCCLESNRNRFLQSDTCEALGSCLTKYSNSNEVSCWVCRALGHLTLSSDDAREVVGSAGACQMIVDLLQKYESNVGVCTEACWAIRNMAQLNENNIGRFVNQRCPETLAAVYKFHYSNEVFAKECCRALSSLVISEDDDILPGIMDSGIVPLIFKSLKKFPESEDLANYAFELMFLLTCNPDLIPRLVSSGILTYLAIVVDQHAGCEFACMWALRTLSKLTTVEGISSKIRHAGLCESTVAAVQRLMKSSLVCRYGCLAIGLIAKEDKTNSQRLSEAGACEACVIALNRHDAIFEAADDICTAIHWLAESNANNVQWFGANGACEAVTSILKRHISTKNVAVIFSAARTLGTLAYREDGNIHRFKTAGASEAIVTAMRKYGAEPEVGVMVCRAIYHLCFDNSCVSELGAKGACGLVVAVLNAHSSDPNVIVQACYAISALAVKMKSDKVHTGNTRKLVLKGTIENIVGVMKRFNVHPEVQSASAMAIASLGRLEANNQKLGEAGCCELILEAFKNFTDDSKVAGKLALAVEVLCTGNENHKNIFGDAKVSDNLLDALTHHESNATVVSEVLRALIVIITHEGSRLQIKADSSVKQVVKVMRIHDKDANVARYAANLLFCIATEQSTLGRIGAYKGCEAVTTALHRHAASNKHVAEWGSKSIVALCKLDANKAKFDNADTCNALSGALKQYDEDPILAEWITAAIVRVSTMDDSRDRLGQSGACQNLQSVLSKHQKSEIIAGLVCEAIYELCGSVANRTLFGDAGAVESVVSVLNTHISSLLVVVQSCKAVAALCRKSSDNSYKAISVDIAHVLLESARLHFMNGPAAEWVCAAVAALAAENVTARIKLVDISISSPGYLFADSNFAYMENGIEGNLCNAIVKILSTHRSSQVVVYQALRAAKNLATENKNNTLMLSEVGVYKSTLSVLKIHSSAENVADIAAWILGTCSALPANPEIYENNSKLEIIVSALQAHRSRDLPSQRLCGAVATFLQHSRQASPAACDAVLETIIDAVRSGRPVPSQAACIASVEAIALAHPDNAAHIGNVKPFAIFEGVLARNIGKSHNEQNIQLFESVFRAVYGIVTGNVAANQARISSSQLLLKHILKIFYNDLEYANISQYACRVISGLVWENETAQLRLTAVCDFIVDVFNAHMKTSYDATLQCLIAISALSHGNNHNRTRLGSSNVCEDIRNVLAHYFDHPDQRIVQWCVRAIGDLSANNYQNQIKFSKTGVNNYLMTIVKKQVNILSQKDASSHPNALNLLNWSLWAVGNLIQPPAKSSNPNAPTSQPNFSKFDEAGIVETVYDILSIASSNSAFDVTTFAWTCRLALNLSRGKVIKAKLVEKGCRRVLPEVFAAISAKKATIPGANQLESFEQAESFYHATLKSLDTVSAASTAAASTA